MKKTLIISFIVFIIDLISKILINNFFTVNSSLCIIKDLFYITYTRNFGAAFSILQNSRFLLIFISVFVLFILIYYIKSSLEIKKIELFAYSFIIGGLFGNLYDRIVYGYVIDFLDIYIFGYDYPVFNIADCAIVMGIIILIFNSFRRSIKIENSSRG